MQVSDFNHQLCFKLLVEDKLIIVSKKGYFLYFVVLCDSPFYTQTVRLMPYFKLQKMLLSCGCNFKPNVVMKGKCIHLNWG